MTMKEMCEAILASPRTPQALKDAYPTGEALFNYDSHGELFRLWFWYDEYVRGKIWIHDPGTGEPKQVDISTLEERR